jgi:pSer/pThr/pTyr-binding forkhead associated (FHA) protein
MVGAEAAVRLVNAGELEEWLARVIVLAPRSSAAPVAGSAAGVAETVEIGSVQTLVMSLSPTVLKIELSDPSEKGRSVTVVGEATLGRQAGNKIVVSEPGVSRIHARIYRDEGGLWTVSDLDTANGTFVNERRIDKPTAIRPGDVIRVSATQLRVLAEG